MQALSNLASVGADLFAVNGLDIARVDRNHGTLKIELAGKKSARSFALTAERTLCVREFDEGDAISYLSGLRSGLYFCAKSDLLDWFSSARSPLDKIEGLGHYILISSDTVIEWLSTAKPTVAVLE